MEQNIALYLRGPMSRDYEAFMQALQERFVCFIYMKMPARGSAFSKGYRIAIGTRNSGLIPEEHAPKSDRKAWMLKRDFYPYWDYVQQFTEPEAKAWRGFYASRWMGWFPQMTFDAQAADGGSLFNLFDFMFNNEY